MKNKKVMHKLVKANQGENPIHESFFPKAHVADLRFFLYPILFLIIFLPNYSYGYGECSDYGIWATYDYLSGGCKCMSGYVLGKGVLGIKVVAIFLMVIGLYLIYI